MLKIMILIWSIANMIAFILMGVDKRKAMSHSWRISEATLFLFGALGGVGATLGMFVFHHKTKHWAFRIFFPLFAIAQIIIILLLSSKI